MPLWKLAKLFAVVVAIACLAYLVVRVKRKQAVGMTNSDRRTTTAD